MKAPTTWTTDVGDDVWSSGKRRLTASAEGHRGIEVRAVELPPAT